MGFLKPNFELGPSRSRHDTTDELLIRHPQETVAGINFEVMKVVRIKKDDLSGCLRTVMKELEANTSQHEGKLKQHNLSAKL
jgi:hypothetical protein